MQQGAAASREVDIVIMAHPKRQDQAVALAREVDARIVWDTENNEWHTGERAWREIRPGADFGLVLQDDAVPLPQLRERVRAVVDGAPRTAISLYVGTGRPRAPQVTRAVTEADRTGAAWLECDGLLWGVAILLPTEHIRPMLDWAAISPLPYDQRIGAWYRRQGLPVRYCWPSIVDHADGPRLATTSGPPNCARRAHRVGIPRLSGPTVNI